MLPLMFHPVFVDDIMKKRHRDSISFSPLCKSKNAALANHMGIEVTSTDAEYRVELDMPGIKSDDIDITVEDDCGRISITGIRRFQDIQHGHGHTVKKAKLSKTFAVDAAAVGLSQLQANLSNGVLVVSAPKLLKSPPRKIAVTTTIAATPRRDDDNHQKSIEKEHSAPASTTEETTTVEQAPINKDEETN
jgi:HSP20 family molecular chaperone IbpA